MGTLGSLLTSVLLLQWIELALAASSAGVSVSVISSSPTGSSRKTSTRTTTRTSTIFATGGSTKSLEPGSAIKVTSSASSTKPTLPATCAPNCFVLPETQIPQMIGWEPIPFSTTLKATMYLIVNKNDNTTRTSTYYPSLPSGYQTLPPPKDTNSAGTRTAWWKLNSGPSSGKNVTLTYPTQFAWYTNDYRFFGAVPTTVSGIQTCATGDSCFECKVSATQTTFANSPVLPQPSPPPVKSDDPSGWLFRIASTTTSFPGNFLFDQLAKNDAAYHICGTTVPEDWERCPCSTKAAPTANNYALYLTETSVSTEEGAQKASSSVLVNPVQPSGSSNASPTPNNAPPVASSTPPSPQSSPAPNMPVPSVKSTQQSAAPGNSIVSLIGAGGSTANTQPANTQPANTQPANTQPANTQPANTQPANTQLANTQPANAQPANTQPGNTGSVLPVNTPAPANSGSSANNNSPATIAVSGPGPVSAGPGPSNNGQQQGTPQQGTSQQGTPQQGTPQQGTPQQANPQQPSPPQTGSGSGQQQQQQPNNIPPPVSITIGSTAIPVSVAPVPAAPTPFAGSAPAAAPSSVLVVGSQTATVGQTLTIANTPVVLTTSGSATQILVPTGSGSAKGTQTIGVPAAVGVSSSGGSGGSGSGSGSGSASSGGESQPGGIGGFIMSGLGGGVQNQNSVSSAAISISSAEASISKAEASISSAEVSISRAESSASSAESVGRTASGIQSGGSSTASTSTSTASRRRALDDFMLVAFAFALGIFAMVLHL